MQTPFLVVSYEQFADSKKLFSFEKEGIHCLPIFTDTTSAILFIRGMTKILRTTFGDDRKLVPQLCTEPRHALDMLMTIASLVPDLQHIVIDANPPTDPEVENLASTTTESMIAIEDAIEDLEKQIDQSPRQP